MSALSFEPITRVAPLGVRFQDEATGEAVRDRLSVTAGELAAVLNPTDVYVFRGVPGLARTEMGRGDDAFWTSPPEVVPLTIRVADLARRFLPFSFRLSAPHQHLLDLPYADLTPPASPPLRDLRPAVPLFSAPARIPPPGLAVVRAELHVATGQPAAFAVLEISTGPARPFGRGVADEHGRVLVLLAYPPPPSGLAPGPRSLENATWTADVHVRYAAGAASGPFPDLHDVLTQPPATAVADAGSGVAMTTTVLAFGREQVLATAGETVLLVT